MKLDRSPASADGARPGPHGHFALARFVADSKSPGRITGPVLGRVLQASDSRYRIETSEGQWTVETNLSLRVRQRVELCPLPGRRSGADVELAIRAVPARSPIVLGFRNGSSLPGPPLPSAAVPEQTGAAGRTNQAPVPSVKASGEGLGPAPAPRSADLSSSRPPLSVPGKADRIHLRLFSDGVVGDRPTRIPVLTVELPELHHGEPTLLRILETSGRRAAAELKGARVIVESRDHPLQASQEWLCRVVQTEPEAILETGGYPHQPRSAKGTRTSPAFKQSAAPFRIVVTDARPPDLPAEAELSAVVQKVEGDEALLALGTVCIRVPNRAGWQAGDRPHLRIGGTPQKPELKIGATGPNYTKPELPANQTVTAIVLRRLMDNRFLVRIGPRVFEAATRAPLIPDAELSVRIERGGSDVKGLIVEQSLPIEVTAQQVLKTHLPNLIPLPQAFANLAKRIGQVAVDRGRGLPEGVLEIVQRLQQYLRTATAAPSDPIRLRDVIRRSGLSFERELSETVQDPGRFRETAQRDLKGMLTELADYKLESGAPDRFMELQQSAEQTLRHLESQQATNLLRSMSGEGIRLLVPFAVGGRLSMVQLEVRRDEERAGGQGHGPRRDTTLVFLLDLEGWGKTRIDARVGTEGIQAHFFVEEEECLTHLRNTLPDLARSLSRAGYPSIRMEVSTFGERTPEAFPHPGRTIAAEDLPATDRLINLQA